MLTALVAIISLFLFSKSILIKKQQYTVNFISQVYQDEMARVFSKLRTAFADEKFDLSQTEIKNFLGYLEEKDFEASVTKMLNFLEAFSLFVN